jgi:hypothetical protein
MDSCQFWEFSFYVRKKFHFMGCVNTSTNMIDFLI